MQVSNTKMVLFLMRVNEFFINTPVINKNNSDKIKKISGYIF